MKADVVNMAADGPACKCDGFVFSKMLFDMSLVGSIRAKAGSNEKGTSWAFAPHQNLIRKEMKEAKQRNLEKKKLRHRRRLKYSQKERRRKEEERHMPLA